MKLLIAFLLVVAPLISQAQGLPPWIQKERNEALAKSRKIAKVLLAPSIVESSKAPKGLMDTIMCGDEDDCGVDFVFSSPSGTLVINYMQGNYRLGMIPSSHPKVFACDKLAEAVANWANPNADLGKVTPRPTTLKELGAKERLEGFVKLPKLRHGVKLYVADNGDIPVALAEEAGGCTVLYGFNVGGN